jgi:hypothetical protein
MEVISVIKLNMSKFISGNASYRSVQNLVSFRVQCKNLEIEVHRATFLPVLYEYETLTSSC